MPEEVLGKCSGCGETVIKGDDTTDKFEALWHPRCLKTRRKDNENKGTSGEFPGLEGLESSSSDDLLGMGSSKDNNTNLFTGEPLK